MNARHPDFTASRPTTDDLLVGAGIVGLAPARKATGRGLRAAASAQGGARCRSTDPATPLVNVTGDAGASTAFGIAEDVFARW